MGSHSPELHSDPEALTFVNNCQDTFYNKWTAKEHNWMKKSSLLRLMIKFSTQRNIPNTCMNWKKNKSKNLAPSKIH
jgi:hypothetical protein